MPRTPRPPSVPTPRDPSAHLPVPLTLFFTARQRARVLRALRDIHPNPSRAALALLRRAPARPAREAAQ